MCIRDSINFMRLLMRWKNICSLFSICKYSNTIGNPFCKTSLYAIPVRWFWILNGVVIWSPIIPHHGLNDNWFWKSNSFISFGLSVVCLWHCLHLVFCFLEKLIHQWINKSNNISIFLYPLYQKFNIKSDTWMKMLNSIQMIRVKILFL